MIGCVVDHFFRNGDDVFHGTFSCRKDVVELVVVDDLRRFSRCRCRHEVAERAKYEVCTGISPHHITIHHHHSLTTYPISKQTTSDSGQSLLLLISFLYTPYYWPPACSHGDHKVDTIRLPRHLHRIEDPEVRDSIHEGHNVVIEIQMLTIL
jgi:hypothetical protein